MKHFVVFLLVLITFGGIYNFPVMRDSLLGFFGNTSYQKEDFIKAQEKYENVLKDRSWSTLIEADILYNLGNTLYQLGEREKGEERIKFWKESIGSYTKSLSIRTDKETEENLTFVKEKLKKEEMEQQEQKKRDTSEKSGSGSEKKPEQTENKSDGDKGNSWQKEGKKGVESGTGKSGKKEETASWSGSEANKPQSGQNWSNRWSYNPVGWQSKDDVDSQLSDIDRQEVKKYTEELKRFEKQNGKLLNPEKWGEAGSLSDQIRDFFGNDSFFQDVITNSDGKKDW